MGSASGMLVFRCLWDIPLRRKIRKSEASYCSDTDAASPNLSPPEGLLMPIPETLPGKGKKRDSRHLKVDKALLCDQERDGRKLGMGLKI